MVRRSTPQHKIDDPAFPVRIFLLVPPYGYGTMLDDVHRWLDEQLGRDNYAIHSGGTLSSCLDLMAVYFRHPRHGAAFLDAFPKLELADGTAQPGYSSPGLPFGRG